MGFCIWQPLLHHPVGLEILENIYSGRLGDPGMSIMHKNMVS